MRMYVHAQLKIVKNHLWANQLVFKKRIKFVAYFFMYAAKHTATHTYTHHTNNINQNCIGVSNGTHVLSIYRCVCIFLKHLHTHIQKLRFYSHSY